MILSGKAIKDAVHNGDIEISPFDEKNLNPASYDFTLGDQVCVYDNWCLGVKSGEVSDGRSIRSGAFPMDVKKKPKTVKFKMSESGFTVYPRIGYLMHTVERVKTTMYVPVLDGKSSIGRLFLQVHATAGFGDPGFDGQFTLEVMATCPLIIYPGMRICQIRFHEMSGQLDKSYKEAGHYVGSMASGAVASQAWKQFESE
jgi:dCTP deaminase